MAYSFKIHIQKKLNYTGTPDLNNVTSVELLTKFTTFTDPDDTPENQLAFAQAEKTIRLFKASDYFQNDLDDEANLGIAFADGTMELSDIGVATSAHTLDVTINAPWGPPPTIPLTSFTRKHFKMARHSDFPVGGANLYEDPEEFKITVAGNFNGTGGLGFPNYINNLDGLVCVVYFGAEGHKNRVAALYIPTAVSPGAAGTISVDCATDSASWTIPIGVDQEFAEQIFDGLSTLYQNTNHYNICSVAQEMIINGGFQSTSQIVVSPVTNTTTYTNLANANDDVILYTEQEVTPPAGASASVVDGISAPTFFADICTASPLADGFWHATFAGEVCPELNAQGTSIYSAGDSGLLGYYNISGITGINTLNIVGLPSFPLQDIAGNVLDVQPYSLGVPFDYQIDFVTWYQSSVNFEVDCVLDTTLINSISSSGSQYGDLLCEVFCCLKKLQDRYEENKLKNPKASALDKKKLNEAMVLFGLFEWAIKCNTKKEKINKYYQNILSATGCSGCSGCD